MSEEEKRPTPHAPRLTLPRSLVVRSPYANADIAEHIGREAYSYRFVYRAFAPLLERWGRIIELTGPNDRLDSALWRARRQNGEPVHLSFQPLPQTLLSPVAPNVAYPFWEFPDIPNIGLGDGHGHDWVEIANQLALLLTASTFTRDAFVTAGVKVPVHIVPVPTAAEYFAVPAWEPGQQPVLEFPAYVFPQPEAPSVPAADPWQIERVESLGAQLRRTYKRRVKPLFHARIDRYLTIACRIGAAVRQARERIRRVAVPAVPRLELSGVVFTTILNPLDPRKNWQDLLSSFLLALGDREDATLVVKLIICPQLAAGAVNDMIRYYQGLGLRHRCKLAFVSAYLTDAQMVALASASTYYVNPSRAEGACLPLQNFLAAGRPGISPVHSAMTDYFSDSVGLVVASHHEPTCWPHDPQQRLTTTWHRLVWQSLHDQLPMAYDLAKQALDRYRALAMRGRARMAKFAGHESVWPRLQAALDSVAARTRRAAATSGGPPAALVSKAS